MQRLFARTSLMVLVSALACTACVGSSDDELSTDLGMEIPLPKLDDRLTVKSADDAESEAITVQGDDCDEVSVAAVGKVHQAEAKALAMELAEVKSLTPMWAKPVGVCAFEVPKQDSVTVVVVGSVSKDTKSEVTKFTDSVKATKKPLFAAKSLDFEGLSDALALHDNQGRKSVTAVVPVGSTLVQVVTIPRKSVKASVVASRSAGVAAQVVAGFRGN